MSALEKEIIERLKTLSEPSKLRVLESIKHESEVLDLHLTAEHWAEQVKVVRAKFNNQMGDSFTAQSLLDEVREEASWLPRES